MCTLHIITGLQFYAVRNRRNFIDAKESSGVVRTERCAFGSWAWSSAATSSRARRPASFTISVRIAEVSSLCAADEEYA